MQVTCPNCGARYAVDPLAIGPVGRIVQCARCAHRWLQTVAAAAAAAMAAIPSAGAVQARPQIDDPIPDIVIRPPRQRASLPVPVEPRVPKFWGNSTVLIAGAVAVVLLVAAGLYLFRGEIVAWMPSEWRSMLSLHA